MATFEYQAVEAGGRRAAGVLSAADERAALVELERRSLTPISVAEQKPKGTGRGGVSPRRLSDGYRQLADLLHAGVPMHRALSLLGRGRSSPKMAAGFAALRDHVGDGGELSDGMTERPELFPKVHVAMVRAGEKGGFLEDVFAKLADFVAAEAELRAKVVGQLVYPAVLAVVGTGVLAVIFGVFVPMFREKMFSKLERLPAISSVVFGASDVVAGYGPALLVAAAVGGVAVWRLRRRPDVRRWLDVTRTRLPVVGPLTRAMAAARFCRLLGTMESNGVPLIAGMQIARDAAGNVLMEDAIDAAIDSVRQGETLAEPLGRSGLFPEDAIEMISVGEAAGNVDRVLLNVAGSIEARVERLLTNAVKLIEPAILVLLAILIASVAIAIILPMTQLSGDV